MDSPTKTRRFFDERLSSKLSIQSNTLKCNSALKLSEDHITQIGKDRSNQLKSNHKYTSSKLQSIKLTRITDEIYSTASINENGLPIMITLTTEYIAIVTSKSNILLYNYKQILIMKIKTNDIPNDIHITAVDLSIDSTYVVAGYSNGQINLWDLKKYDPIITINPVTFYELQYNGSHHHVAHQEGSAIRRISFTGLRHTAFIASDDNKMVIYHNCGRSFMGFHCRSKIILGKYNLTPDIPNYNNTILDLHLLPMGSKLANTDGMNLVSVITPSTLFIISLQPEIITHFKIDIPETPRIASIGCCSWFPSTKNNEFKVENLPMLAYSWSNIITIIDITSDLVTNEYEQENTVISAMNNRTRKLEESIISLNWLTGRVLLALTKSKKLLFLDSSSLQVLKECDFKSKNLKYTQCYMDNDIELYTKSYYGSIKTMKSNLFTLHIKELCISNLSNWADVLLDYLNDQRYVDALEESKRQYEGCDDLPLLNLPDDKDIRHNLMKDYLVRIFKSSLKYIFKDKNSDFRKITLLTIETCRTINAPVETYDLIYDKLLEMGSVDIFFEILENFIFSAQITTFSPTILKEMIVYYTNNNNTEILEELICLLDIEQLDIDLTISLCKKYHLNEIYAYIWTTLLHDYFTPLIDAIKKIKLLEKGEIDSGVNYIFPYISYTLTGRQFPTDKLLPQKYYIDAQLNIFYFLYNGSSIAWPNNELIHTVDDIENEPAFPYLHLLIKYDSSSMFSCLNESFENDLLNETEVVSIDENSKMRVNRQYIIDVLLNIFHDENSEDFNIIDRIRLSIFVSRNYPKYPQFIRIADSIADELILYLCQGGLMRGQLDEEIIQDCELALQSLLTIYKPIDIESVILKVEQAKYYQVLLNLYQNEDNYLEVLKLWIKIKSSKGEEIELFKPVSDILAKTLHGNENVDKKDVIKLLNENFELFVSTNPRSIAEIVCNVCPELNSSVVNFKDSSVKFEYLKEIFSMKDEGKQPYSKGTLNENLKFEYLKSLLKRKKKLNLIMENNKKSEIENDEIFEEKTLIEDKIRDFLIKLDNIDDNIIQFLESDEIDEIELIIDWYIYKEEFQKAIDELCKLLINRTNKMLEFGYSEENEQFIWKFINIGFSLIISTNPKFDKIDESKKITLKEKLLLQLVEISVKLLTKVTRETKNEKIIDLFKKNVQCTFTYIINISNDDKSFGVIFEKFLDGSSTQITTLGDVRNILKEIFLTYTTDEKILNIISKLVDEDIFVTIEILKDIEVKGWSPKNVECETCGKKIWGNKIGNRVYENWRDFKLSLDISNCRLYEIFVYQCGHSYHRKCLENMGMIQDEDKKCILCNQESS